MIVVLPLLSFVFIALCFAAHDASYRKAFLSAAVSCGLLLTAVTEILSLTNLINYASLSVFWGFVAASSISYFIVNRTRLKTIKLSSENILIHVGIGIILATTLLVAIIAPPNNWDSMTYHMSRVMHWIQNQSVSHYPTNITRQLYSAPWAEYVIMHLQILSGGDHFANLVQWFAMCGSIIGVMLIAREFGASAYIQLFAASIVSTIPMGILQASSTQNDYVVSFWLVCFVYFGLLLLREQKWINAISAGSSLGLAVLTKGTAYIFAFPFIIWFLFTGIKAHSHKLFKYLLVISAIFIALNAGHYLRNYALWGNPLATDEVKFTNEHINMKVLISNLSRNLISQTWTPIKSINMLQYRGVEMLHDSLDVDISDPATSLNEEKFTARRTSYHEDYAGNGLHLLLFLSIIPAIVLYRHGMSQHMKFYCTALVGGFFLFSLLLKWQLWGNRLQLPLYVLSSPLIAVTMPAANKRWLINVVMTVLLLCSLPSLLKNDTRPLWREWSILTVERERLYFVNRSSLESDYLKVADYFGKPGSCKNIGIYSTVDAYEYPFWVLLSKRTDKIPRIEHIHVSNISGTIMLRDFQPCAVIELF